MDPIGGQHIAVATACKRCWRDRRCGRTTVGTCHDKPTPEECHFAQPGSGEHVVGGTTAFV
jgi:hypothetical protein